MSIRKIHFYVSILKVFLILFYANTNISILILFQKYFLQDWRPTMFLPLSFNMG